MKVKEFFFILSNPPESPNHPLRHLGFFLYHLFIVCTLQVFEAQFILLAYHHFLLGHLPHHLLLLRHHTRPLDHFKHIFAHHH